MSNETAAGPSLLVFSDDWGRHPSSCQHLVRRLLPETSTVWVNTIGTRTPKLNWMTAKRVWEKLRDWRHVEPTDTESTPQNLTVLNPRMWPWFTRTRDRRWNRALLTRQLKPIVESLPQPVIALTTLPITADLPGQLPVAKWVYYCVDDFSVWPGLDGDTLANMDRDMLQAADDVIVVSETLQDHAVSHGRSPMMLTHGVDLEHWRNAVSPKPTQADREEPIILFWGVIDRRMDVEFLEALSNGLDRGTIVLLGPQQDPDPKLSRLSRVELHPPVPFAELPSWAAKASVLIMPYVDEPVTRAMQPLKLKEYLATGRAVVTRQLPAVREWDDCLDAVTTPQTFADRVIERIYTDVPVGQQTARQRLTSESWAAKARVLESVWKPHAEISVTPTETVSHAE
ncbi:glycosyltransferase [Thalassoroseus pseudoceratinae]|uniref:glycosyltransferase n=1 Tax=Thalassoroseus pseudoceratinae TaxID=2713176 RepID=UPI00141F0F70|nr:glycosyltransferase [Thalassoroseus pseudoceratinae]